MFADVARSILRCSIFIYFYFWCYNTQLQMLQQYYFYVAYLMVILFLVREHPTLTLRCYIKWCLMLHKVMRIFTLTSVTAFDRSYSCLILTFISQQICRPILHTLFFGHNKYGVQIRLPKRKMGLHAPGKKITVCAARTPRSMRALALLRLQVDLFFPDLPCVWLRDEWVGSDPIQFFGLDWTHLSVWLHF